MNFNKNKRDGTFKVNETPSLRKPLSGKNEGE